ncbi:unnamed protein product, partial [Ectocarpus fasciculatus]
MSSVRVSGRALLRLSFAFLAALLLLMLVIVLLYEYWQERLLLLLTFCGVDPDGNAMLTWLSIGLEIVGVHGEIFLSNDSKYSKLYWLHTRRWTNFWSGHTRVVSNGVQGNREHRGTQRLHWE